jgi:hypothetical protein
MDTVRINDTNVFIQDNDVIFEDRFGDITALEVKYIMGYLVREGFLPPKGKINVFFRKPIGADKVETPKSGTEES